MREEQKQSQLIDLGAATVLTKGIPEVEQFEELLGEDYRE